MHSSQDAAVALREIESAEARSAMLHGYQRSASQLVLWGVLWVIGYGLNDVFPAYGRAIWAAIVPIWSDRGVYGPARYRSPVRLALWRRGGDADGISHRRRLRLAADRR